MNDAPGIPPKFSRRLARAREQLTVADEVGLALRDHRRSLGLSQRAYAASRGLSRAMLARLEAGSRPDEPGRRWSRPSRDGVRAAVAFDGHPTTPERAGHATDGSGTDGSAAAGPAAGGRGAAGCLARDRPRGAGPGRLGRFPAHRVVEPVVRPSDVVVDPRVLRGPTEEPQWYAPVCHLDLRPSPKPPRRARRPRAPEALRLSGPLTPPRHPRRPSGSQAKQPPRGASSAHRVNQPPVVPLCSPGEASGRLVTRYLCGRLDRPAARAQSEWPTSTGSLTRVTPKASRTPSRTSRARAATSDAVAPPRFVTASVCLVDSAAGPGRPKPLAKPARSISQAALVLTSPSASAKRGGAGDVRAQPRRPPGAPAPRSRRRRQDRVGEERPAAPGVVVGRVEHHAPAPALRQHRLARLGQRHPRPRRSTPSWAARSA